VYVPGVKAEIERVEPVRVVVPSLKVPPEGEPSNWIGLLKPRQYEPCKPAMVGVVLLVTVTATVVEHELPEASEAVTV
jgi:hypothetical protein